MSLTKTTPQEIRTWEELMQDHDLIVTIPAQLPAKAVSHQDTLVINVTQRDIDNGMRGDGNFCPIAWATKRTTGARTTSIGREWARWNGSGKSFRMPDYASRFVQKFDTRKHVRPIVINIRGGK